LHKHHGFVLVEKRRKSERVLSTAGRLDLSFRSKVEP
jgi:hypothetical protein